MGLGGPNLVTHGFGPITVAPQIPVTQSGGGGSILVPEAVVLAEARVKVIHVQKTKKILPVITNHLDIVLRLPVKIRKVIFDVVSSISAVTLEAFSSGLSLNIRDSGIRIDEDKS